MITIGESNKRGTRSGPLKQNTRISSCIQNDLFKFFKDGPPLVPTTIITLRKLSDNAGLSKVARVREERVRARAKTLLL